MAATLQTLATLPVFLLGTVASLIAGLFTAVGALPVLLGKGVGARLQNTLLGFAAAVLPLGLAVAAGAMLFVISNEIIPETHRKPYASHATGGLMIGFVVMMQLDVLLA